MSETTLFLTGDVMTGRGIDQVLTESCAPHLYEPYARSALEYVALAERTSGPIPRPVAGRYVWGEALRVLERINPDARIINLETSLTLSEDAEPKGINYRMHPGNVSLFSAARIDCCVLANNHVLDWGERGLLDTLTVLRRTGIATAGAGRDLREASTPAILQLRAGRRLLVFAVGAADSGVPTGWLAGKRTPGINLLPGYSDGSVAMIARQVTTLRRPGDLVLLSIHWGGNWSFEIPAEHRSFARRLIDEAGVDVVHGHSSHHPKGVEVHAERPIFYGCGDFLNDYEGIGGYERYRGELVLMYFPRHDTVTGKLLALEMIPLRIQRFQLHAASAPDRDWMHDLLARECGRFGHGIARSDSSFRLLWK